MISHIFFDLHGTLIDAIALHPCYSQGVGVYLAERFGGRAEAWAQANRRILSDWDSYFADLNLSGDEGLRDMWEGSYRVTRAMFRLVSIAEPPAEVLREVARLLPGVAPRQCDAVYPDARLAVQACHTAGLRLGITSHAIASQAEALLQGGRIRSYFTGPIVGPDVAGRFDKDETFYGVAVRLAGVSPSQCLVVDDRLFALQSARQAGLGVVHLARPGAGPASPDMPVLTSLADLPDWLAGLTA